MVFPKILSKLSEVFPKKKILVLFFLIVIAGIFAAEPVLAQSEQASMVTKFLAWVIEGLVSFFGGVILLEVKILIRIVQYNDFIKSTAVTNGWVIVRDLCNIFFIVVLLIISIATILKIEMYHYKKLLGRLVIMVILINFSKMICGIIIDFAQVLMMTFVNGFSAAAGGNFVQALKLDKIMQIQTGQEVSESKILGAYLLALIMVIVSCITVGVMIIVFLMRMIMLWVLIVLSPLAYFLSTFPQGQKYASQWWSQFGNYVVVGPVLAFFLWLSLLSVSAPGPSDLPPETKGEEDVEQRVAISKVAGEQEMISFIIAIGMLIGGLMITQQMGVMGSSVAGGAVSWMQRKGMAPARWASRRIKTAATRAGERAGGFISAKTGGLIELRPVEREKRRAERHAAVMRKRDAERQIRGAAMMERAPLLTAMFSPRAIPEVGRLTGIAAKFGIGQAREKLKMAAEGRRNMGYATLRGIDPIGAFEREQKTEAPINRRRAEQEIKKADRMKDKIMIENKDLFDSYRDSDSKVRAFEEQFGQVDKSMNTLFEEENTYRSQKSKIEEIDQKIAQKDDQMRREKDPRKLDKLETQRDALKRERGEIEAKLKLTPDFQVEEIENKLRKLDAEFKIASPERKTAINKERSDLDKRRQLLAQNTFGARKEKLNQEKSSIYEQLSKEKERRESFDNQIREKFEPVQKLRKEAEKYNEAARRNEAFLKLDVNMKVEKVKEKLTEDKQNLQMKMWKFIQEEARKKGKSEAAMFAELEKVAGGQIEAAAQAAAKPTPSKT